MEKQYRSIGIDSNDTFHPVAVSCFVSQIIISCSNAGTAWTLRIEDNSSPPLIWIPAFTLTIPTDGKPYKLFFDEPLFFKDGIDIVTAGTLHGVVAVNFVGFA